MFRRIAWVVAILAVVASGYLYYTKHPRASDAPHYETVDVQKGPLIGKVTATGTLSALVTVQVGSQDSGRVSKLMVDYNSPVTKGELIAKIDPQLFEASVENAKANLAQAEGQLAQAEANERDTAQQLKRDVPLAAQKLIAPQDLESARAKEDANVAAIASAKGNLAQSKAQLHLAEINLAYTDIISPIDGTVISRSVDVGQTVAASLQAPTLFTIAQDLKKMQVDTNVAEADVGKLQDTMKASFTVDAYPTTQFIGHIRQIRNASQTVQNVVTYDAVIDVDNPDLKLRPGMTANITFVYARRDDALMVANAALRFRPPPGFGQGPGSHRSGRAGGGETQPHPSAPKDLSPDERTIWVLRGDQPRSMVVKVGLTDGSNTELLTDAVEEGDKLITAAPDHAGASGGQSMPMRRLF